MLICIPTNGDSGFNDTLNDHFGSAPYFTLYDGNSNTIKTVKNRNSSHSHGTCHPMIQLKKYHIDSIVCSGIGKRAIEMLNNEGIKVYQSDKKIVADAVEQIKNNELSEIDASKACKGHGQRQGLEHGRSSGCGSGFKNRGNHRE